MDRSLTLKVVTNLQDKLSGPLRKIGGAGATSAKAMQALRSRLKDLEGAQKNISQWRTLKREFTESSGKMQAAQARVNELAAAMAGSNGQTIKMRKEFDQAKKAASRLKDELASKATNLQTVRDRLNAAGVSTKNLSGTEKELRDKITQTNQALDQQRESLGRVAEQQRKLNAAKEKFKNSQQLASNMATSGAAGLAAGSGALYAGYRMMAPGIQFDQDMSRVQALTRLEKDNAKLAELRDQARKLGAETMFSATEAAQGQGYLAMAGFNPDDILGAMPGMLDLAKSGATELGATAEIASNILQGFGINANEMTRVGDVLVGTFTRSNTNLAMLGETMGYAGPIAASLGQDIETVAAMTAKLGDAGIQGGKAGTALRAILSRMAAPPKMAADAMAELGLQVADAAGNMRPMPDLLKEIYDRTKDMGEIERAGILKAISGTEAVTGMQILVKEAGSGNLQKFEQTLRNTNGEAQKTSKIMGDNLVGDLDELSSAWEDLGIQMQQQQNGPMRATVVMLADLVGSVAAWATRNPELVSGLIRVAAVLAILVAAGGALMIALAGIIGPIAAVKYGMTVLGIKGGALARVLPMIGKAILFVGRALLMNPIGLTILAIAGAAYLIYQYWEPIKAFFGGLWDQVTAAFNGGIGGVTALIVNWSPLGLFYKAFAGVMSWFGVELPGKFTEFGTMIMQGLINGIKGMIGSVRDSVVGVADSTVGWFREKLGIQSPSRVFMAMGENVSEGAALGIERGQDLARRAAGVLAASVAAAGMMGAPGMSSAIQAMPALHFDTRPAISATNSGSASNRAAGGVGGVVVQGDTIHINITAAPGAQAQDIAQAVAAELDKRDRAKAARARSSLSDYGN